ncbi:hypothetical protein IAR55_005045 [Kwoniella newhampshirensis]|uniref:U4/U6.U5 small nuclear ribonucleoprotein 27kDa protein domain-containing protein n=1 Tax=Kwoniella newhampshirensis TaxID=1651941 RepID=A0AAW0YX50_9TREE
MSSRPPPSHLSPRDRDRRYARERDDEPVSVRARERERDRDRVRSKSRSRSPVRREGRYDDRHGDRDRKYDRDRPKGGYDRERQRRDYPDGPAVSREIPAPPSGPSGGPIKREGRYDSPSFDSYSNNPNNDPNYRPSYPRGGGGGGGRGGYGGRGGGGSGRGGGHGGYDDRGEYNTPLDRRAIEEGRRRREEERAKGIVYTDDGTQIIPGQDGSGVKEEPKEEVDMDDPEAAMAAMMGFGGFDSTKGKGIPVNADGAVKVNKQRTWRQYMNRRGGFNRPLEKMKD